MDRSVRHVSKRYESETKNVNFCVLANPVRRCGVRLTAEQHAKVLGCQLITDPAEAEKFDFVYLHWHPNFEWQHPVWAKSLRNLTVPAVLVVHDFLYYEPTQSTFFIATFDRNAAPNADAVIRMPLQQPYPFVPRTEPDPDMCGFFGFFHSGKGTWAIADYAARHKKKARFITTLHPFAPPWVQSEFVEFKATVKRLGFEIIDEWLVDQELADVMGECGFFIVLHKGQFGASGSVTSAFAASRPAFVNASAFLRHVKPFAKPFRPDKWPSEAELREAQTLVEKARQALDPEVIWKELHKRALAKFYSRCYNRESQSDAGITEESIKQQRR